MPDDFDRRRRDNCPPCRCDCNRRDDRRDRRRDDWRNRDDWRDRDDWRGRDNRRY